MLYFHNDVLGIPILINGCDDIELVNSNFDHSGWFISNKEVYHNNIRAASRAAGCNIEHIPKTPQAAFWMLHQSNPRWFKILSKDQLAAYTNELIKHYSDFLSNSSFEYFLTHYQDQQKLIDSFCAAKINKNNMHIAKKYDINIDKSDFADVVKYDNWSSATGRMTVVSGPKILTMQKDDREVFQSQYGNDGSLIEIDYNALDARVLLAIMNIGAPQSDLYTFIAKKCNLTCERAVIKEAVLAALYGMSVKNFIKRYPDFPDALDVLQSVKDFFDVKKLTETINKLPTMQNYFGRTLHNGERLISHYVQSSAVDVVCQGFLKILEQIEEPCPIFIIHDALILDVKKKNIQNLKNITSQGIINDKLQTVFPVKLKEFLE